jgi:hypothetical protein
MLTLDLMTDVPCNLSVLDTLMIVLLGLGGRGQRISEQLGSLPLHLPFSSQTLSLSSPMRLKLLWQVYLAILPR